MAFIECLPWAGVIGRVSGGWMAVKCWGPHSQDPRLLSSCPSSWWWSGCFLREKKQEETWFWWWACKKGAGWEGQVIGFFFGNTLHLRCLLDVLSVITNGKLLNAKCIFPKILEYTVFHFCYTGPNFCLTFHQPNAASCITSFLLLFLPSFSFYLLCFLSVDLGERK